MDEFGKGSAETDGIGLLLASIAQLRRLGARALVTTHFLEIFHEALIPRDVADAICFRMDVYVPPAQLPPPPGQQEQQLQQSAPQSTTIQTIVPLFKLTKGVASSSDGFSCAVLAGIATPVVQRAECVSACILILSIQCEDWRSLCTHALIRHTHTPAQIHRRVPPRRDAPHPAAPRAARRLAQRPPAGSG